MSMATALVLLSWATSQDDETEYRRASVTPEMEAIGRRMAEVRAEFDQALLRQGGHRPRQGEWRWAEVWTHSPLPMESAPQDSRGFVFDGVFLARGTQIIAEWETKRSDIKRLYYWLHPETATLQFANRNHTYGLEDAKPTFADLSSRIFGKAHELVVSKHDFDTVSKSWVIHGHYTHEGEIVRYSDGRVKGYVARVNAVVNLLEDARFMPVAETK